MKKQILTIGLCLGIAMFSACGNKGNNSNSGTDSTGNSSMGTGSDSSSMKGANPQSDSTKSDSGMKRDSSKTPGTR